MMQGYYADPIVIVPPHPPHAASVTPCGWDDEFNDVLADDMATGKIATTRSSPTVPYRRG
jgi:hypothetical protein